MRYETEGEPDTGNRPFCLRSAERRSPKIWRQAPSIRSRRWRGTVQRRGGVSCRRSKPAIRPTAAQRLILKASPGCVVPWHFHTAEEQLIVTGGAVLAEMTGHQPARLGPGQLS